MDILNIYKKMMMNCLRIFISQELVKGEKIMINYNKNKLINKTLDKYYETFSHMLDTLHR